MPPLQHLFKLLDSHGSARPLSTIDLRYTFQNNVVDIFKKNLVNFDFVPVFRSCCCCCCWWWCCSCSCCCSVHLQMIIRRNRPLANDHQEGPASCKKLSDTPVTLVTSARIQIQSRGPFWNNLFLFSLYSCVRLCANYFPVTQEPFLTLMKFLSPGNRVVLSRRLTGTMFWKCFCPLQEFKSLVSFTSQLSQMFREDQWEWWGDKGPVWEHVRQVPWKPGKVSFS